MKKLYFSNQDGYEWANTIKTWKDIMRIDNIESMELVRAKSDRGNGFFFCREYHEFGESSESCGKQCDGYSPRNGKNGICKHNGPCFSPDKSEKVTIKISTNGNKKN